MRRGGHHHWQWQRMAQAWRLLAALFAAAQAASLLVVGCPAPDCPGSDCLAADCSVAGRRAAARFPRLPAPAWRPAAEIAMPGPAAAAGSEPQSRLRKHPLRLRPIQYEHYPAIGAMGVRRPNRDGKMKVRARPRYRQLIASTAK